MKKSILIIGGGFGLSWSIARLFSKEGMDVSIASRNIEKYANLDSEIKLNLYNCDASIIEDVNKLFENIDKNTGTPDLVVYNPSARVSGPIGELNPNEVKKALEITCLLYTSPSPRDQVVSRMPSSA